MKRCAWADSMTEYHDKEWGVQLHDDRLLFEFLCLEGAQAGLSWSTVLNKRDRYRKVYFNFDPKKVAKITDKYNQKLLLDAGIIRNRLKVKAFVTNANAFLEIQKEFGSFDKYIWGFVNHKQIKNNFKKIGDYPAKTDLSDEIAKDMKKRGFTFVGSTIMYAFMQAVGMVNDHEVTCFRYKEVQ